MSKMNFEPRVRPYVKLECLRLLATLKLNPVKSRLISGFVHTYLKLDAQENVILIKEMETLEPEQKEEMAELTNKWIEEGERRGLEAGVRLGIHNLLYKMGIKRFWTPPESISKEIDKIDETAKLEMLCERIYVVKTWQEVLEN